MRLGEAGRLDEVGLVEHEQVGGAQLPEDLVAGDVVRGALAHRLGVGDDDGGVLAIARQVAEHDDRAGIGDAAGLHDDVLGRVGAVAQQRELADEVARDAAADAAVLQADHLAVARLDELGVDVDRAEVVDEDGEAAIARVAQERVEQRRLARAEKAADDGQLDRFAGVVVTQRRALPVRGRRATRLPTPRGLPERSTTPSWCATTSRRGNARSSSPRSRR